MARVPSESMPVRERFAHDINSALTVKEREELVFLLLKDFPLSNIANIQRRITPLLQFDMIEMLPDEIGLLVFSNLPWRSLLACSLVCRRWRTLAEDPALWRDLCKERNWEWKTRQLDEYSDHIADHVYGDLDDEGMGDDEEEEEDRAVEHILLCDSVSTPMDVDSPRYSPNFSRQLLKPLYSLDKPDYKLLFQTHIVLKHRVSTSAYNLSTLQTSGSPNGHNNTIYCLQLYTYPETGRQVLFTGSKDRTIREWDMATGAVIRVFERVHRGSVLSICARNGLLVSGGSDCAVIVWDLKAGMHSAPIRDHVDSVLCVRLDSQRLVTCSKDRTIRTYHLPDFTPEHTLQGHRAAVNAVSLCGQYIASASGDRSMRVWDAETGQLLQSYENHHGRGLASIDFRYPYALSGSSDRHLRLLNLTTSQGWSTAPNAASATTASTTHCENCAQQIQAFARRSSHKDLVRSVALAPDFVVSGSYDHTVKVWDRETGSLLADLSGGHTGRVFCVDVDSTKIVSCGEDQRICIWDFSHGIDTSFLKL